MVNLFKPIIFCSFSVESTNGQISTLAMLNHEERSVYHLTLVGQDGTVGASTPHRVTTLIVVRVTDVNDNTPILLPASHTAFLTEGLSYTNFLFVHVSTIYMSVIDQKTFSVLICVSCSKQRSRKFFGLLVA